MSDVTVHPTGGPKTEVGKEVVRWNATRHGIRSPTPVVPGVEKAEEWEDHRDGVLGSLSPVGHLEFVLADRVALLSWRLHRVIRYETESIALFQEKGEDDLADRRRFASRVLGAAHPEDVRENLKSARSDHRLLKRFPKLEDVKHVSSFDADRILWAVAEVTDRVAEGEIAPEDLLEEISIPGVPDGAEEREDYEGWNAGAVRAGIEAIASATDEEPEELLEVATDSARREVIGKDQAPDEVDAVGTVITPTVTSVSLHGDRLVHAFLLGAKVRPGRRGGSPSRTPRLPRPYHPERQRRLSVGERYVKARRAGSSHPAGREFLDTP